MGTDERYMQRCLDLAVNGMGRVAPNPMVGCVVVYDGHIIGEGYHRRYGGRHAEVHALEAVSDPSLLPRAALYVNLEPCSHQGKTPPCAGLLIRKKIGRVVVATLDPNPEVAGKGLLMLRENGIDVTLGVCGDLARQLNRRFFTFHEKKRPYVILKWAQTADGFIDIIRKPGAPARPTWITSEKLRMLVHKWRSEEAAIMVGTNTALLDNPTLNVRHWHGRQPLRVVIDKKCILPNTLNIFHGEQPTLVYNHVRNARNNNISWVRLPPGEDMPGGIMRHLYTEGIQSVLVEGGRYLLQALIDQNLYDEARVFTGNQFFGDGCRAPLPGNVNTSRIIMENEGFFWHMP